MMNMTYPPRQGKKEEKDSKKGGWVIHAGTHIEEYTHWLDHTAATHIRQLSRFSFQEEGSMEEGLGQIDIVKGGRGGGGGSGEGKGVQNRLHIILYHKHHNTAAACTTNTDYLQFCCMYHTETSFRILLHV